jgi:hypothetical protein
VEQRLKRRFSSSKKGMETARLEAIVRQRDPALRAVVEQLACGEVRGAVHQLDAQGRVHAITHRGERLAAIAREYLRQPTARWSSRPTIARAWRSIR